MKAGAVTTLGVAALLLAACSSPNDENIAVTKHFNRSIAHQMRPAPSLDPNRNPPVPPDPCMTLGDEAITEAGFYPNTRKRSDQIQLGYAFIGCSFNFDEIANGSSWVLRSMLVTATNITVDQFRLREGSKAKAMKVNEKNAAMYVGSFSGNYNVVIERPTGSLHISISGGTKDWTSSDHYKEIAAIVDAAMNESS